MGQEGLGQSDSQEASGHQFLCKATQMSVLPLSRGLGQAVFRGPSSAHHPHACMPGDPRTESHIGLHLGSLPLLLPMFLPLLLSVSLMNN